MNLGSILILTLFVGNGSGILEQGFFDYSVSLAAGDDDVLVVGREIVNLTKSMLENSLITYTMNCYPKKDVKKGEAKNKFSVTLTLFHNYCHVPGKENKIFVKSYPDIPCHKHALAELMKTNVGNFSQPGINASQTGNDSTRTNAVSGKPTVGKNQFYTTLTGLFTVELSFYASDNMTIEGRIESTHEGSFLSAMMYPLLPFYGVTSLLYLAYAVGWFFTTCCNWKDLLRVQFWIGGVIALGMFENALFYSEYQSISHHGKANGLLYFAEIVSCAKRALARVLVVIVSIGFGIVKPRLGQTLHKVLIVGGAYFIIASIEGCLRVHDEKKFFSDNQMIALVPLTVLDVSICWWIFTSLVQTTRTLRIRKNVVKLTLYRHFTNTLIFTVLASLAYMIYMIRENKISKCISISTFWLNEALWPFLFAVILAVIMVLWRPSINNQRYAFTPLDLDNDDEDDMTLSDAFEGMKLRNTSDKTNVKNRKAPDDDLKWVEENIPSVPSTLLPIIDSDEEILTTKFEQSKMN